jgi:hypothetical protein
MSDYYPHTGGYNEEYSVPAGDPYDVQDDGERYVGDSGTPYVEDFDESNGDDAFSDYEDIN